MEISTLRDKVAVVTGASRGIGRATAIALSRAGARVALVARDAAALQDVADECGAGAVALPCDLADRDRIEGLAADVTGRFGAADILVNSAGIFAFATMAEARLDDLDAQYATNLRGPYAVAKALLPALIAARGEIVFVNSSVVRAASLAGRGQYAAFEHALKAVADSIRDEVNQHGVRVLSIYPGVTATPRQAAIHQQSGAPYSPERMLQPEDVAGMIVAAISLARTAEVYEIFLRPMMKSA